MGRVYVGDGNSFVWQWQPKERIVLDGYPDGVFVHYANCKTEEAPVVQSRRVGDKLIADIPPELMQEDLDITVYVCDVDGTKHCHFLSVLSRPKPESYVTEPVEVLRYESLAERVKKLEKEGGSGGSSGPAYVASDAPPADTRALWVDTAEQGEAVALGVTAVETAEGVDLYCTDELGTTKVSLRHGKDGAPGSTPVKGVDYFTEDEVQEIAETAAGMVDGEEGTTLLDTSVEIPAESPVTEMEWELPEEAKRYNVFYSELYTSKPTNSPSNNINVRLSVCGNELAGSSNGNGVIRKDGQTWVTALAELDRRCVLNATFNNSPLHNISSSMSLFVYADALPISERNNLFRVRLLREYAGTVTVKIVGYSRKWGDSDA